VLAWVEKLVARLAIEDDKEALRQRLEDARERRRRLDV